ncbi:MAG: hypothetical protein P1U63_04660 [Coxiellaceae bacterium]|nr:hypothetical protein [Coxiellaceae bacterium]
MNQNIAYIVTAAIVYAILAFVRPVIAYNPHGIALPIAKSTATQTSNDVTVLPPWKEHGKKLAWVNVEYHQLTQSKAAADAIVRYATELVRKQGGDGLVIQQMGFQPPQAVGKPLAMYVLRGVAVQTNANTGDGSTQP